MDNNAQIDSRNVSIKLNTSPLLSSSKRVVKSILPVKVYSRFKNAFYKKIDLLNKKLQSNNRRFNKLPQGVNLFVYNLNNSASEIARSLQQVLDNAGIPYHTFDLCDLEKCKSEFETTKPYSINLVSCHAASNAHRALDFP